NLLLVMKDAHFAVGSSKLQFMNLDLPVNFLYRNGGFFAGGGPNLSYGLSAKTKPYDSSDESADLYDNGDNSLKRFSAGINLLMGYEFPSGFTLSSSYAHGITSVAPDDTFGSDTK